MSLLSGLLNGQVRLPDAAINYGNKPLPMFPPGALQFSTPDGRFGDSGSLLPGGLQTPYAYGRSARISTQTQMAHPNKVALIIPKLFLPAPESDNFGNDNPALEHSISDGDLVFTLKMGSDMASFGSMYYMAPYGHAAKTVPLINLATANYILWGLQVGIRREKSMKWKDFFSKLTNGKLSRYPEELSLKTVWNFIQTYILPFGVMHGSDLQGGQHEGSANNIVTHAAVDYVSSFAIEGKLLHVNNMWRDCDVHENDDLILAVRKMEAPHLDVTFNLSSSTRSFRSERVPISNSWYFLRPEVSQFRSFSDIPYIHVGRSQKYCSMFTRGKDICCWDSRMCVVPGAPLQLTFEPGFVNSDAMTYAKWELNIEEEDADEGGGAGLRLGLQNPESPKTAVAALPQPHLMTRGRGGGGRRPVFIHSAPAGPLGVPVHPSLVPVPAIVFTGDQMPAEGVPGNSNDAVVSSLPTAASRPLKKPKTATTTSKMSSAMQEFGSLISGRVTSTTPSDNTGDGAAPDSS
jgi:hypothetical protein